MPYLGGANSVPPDGWLFCTGRPVSRTEYGDLFAEIGVRYGAGNGSTTFNLPGPAQTFFRGGLSGVVGFSSTPGSSSHSHAFTTNMSISVGNEQSHNHSTNAGSTNTSSWSHTHRIVGVNTGGPNSTGNRLAMGSLNRLIAATSSHTHTFDTTTVTNDAAHNHTINTNLGAPTAAHNHNVTIGNATNDNPFYTDQSSSTNPPNIQIWHIIKT